MMRIALLVALAALAPGCQAESFERVSLGSQGLSVRILEGFDLEADKGSIVLSGPGKATIVVRAAQKDDPRRGRRTSEDISRATRQVLRSYKGVNLKKAEAVEDAHMDGIRYSMTFRPRGTDVYERTHVVLFGTERVYHLWHTAPEGELGETQKRFDQLVASAREEG